MASQCDSCAWLDVDVVQVSRQQVVEKPVCLYSLPKFPRAQDCTEYLPVDQAEGG